MGVAEEKTNGNFIEVVATEWWRSSSEKSSGNGNKVKKLVSEGQCTGVAILGGISN